MTSIPNLRPNMLQLTLCQTCDCYTQLSFFNPLPLSTIQRRLENVPDRWFMDFFNVLLYSNILFQWLVSLCRILNYLYSNYTAEDSLH